MKKFKYFKASINLTLARLFNPQLMSRITELDAIDTPSMQQLNCCVRCKARSRWSSREVLKGTGTIQYDTITTRFLGDLFKIRFKKILKFPTIEDSESLINFLFIVLVAYSLDRDRYHC